MNDFKDIYGAVKDIIEIFIVPYCVYVVNKLQRLDTKVEVMNTTLVGQDGQNGLRSRFTSMEKRLANLSFSFARYTGVKARDMAEEEDNGEN